MSRNARKFTTKVKGKRFKVGLYSPVRLIKTLDRTAQISRECSCWWECKLEQLLQSNLAIDVDPLLRSAHSLIGNIFSQAYQLEICKNVHKALLQDS